MYGAMYEPCTEMSHSQGANTRGDDDATRDTAHASYLGRQLEPPQRSALGREASFQVVSGQHHVAIAVACRLDDARDALLRDGEEGVRRGRRAHGVDGDTIIVPQVGQPLLEANGGGEARGELTV